MKLEAKTRLNATADLSSSSGLTSALESLGYTQISSYGNSVRFTGNKVAEILNLLQTDWKLSKKESRLGGTDYVFTSKRIPPVSLYVNVLQRKATVIFNPGAF